MSIWEQIYSNLIAQDRWMLILRGLGTTLLIAFGAIIDIDGRIRGLRLI